MLAILDGYANLETQKAIYSKRTEINHALAQGFAHKTMANVKIAQDDEITMQNRLLVTGVSVEFPNKSRINEG